MMRLVWGERWAQAAEFLRILGFTLAFRTVFSFGKAQLEAIGAFASIFIISLIDVTIIAGLLLSFKHLGLTATELVIASRKPLGLAASPSL